MEKRLKKIEFEEKRVKEDLLGSFVSYIKKPDYNIELEQKSFLKKLSDIFYFVSLAVVLSFVLGILASALMEKIGYDTNQNSVVELFNEVPVWFFMLLALLWAPISEELCFRLPLRRASLNLAVSASFFLLFFFSAMFEFSPVLSGFVKKQLENLSFISLIFFFLAYLVSSIYFFKIIFKKFFPAEKQENFYRKNFSYIFYFSIFIFGAVHIMNFNNLASFWYISFVLFLPQLSASFILAYVRMRYGIIFSIILHFLYNGIFTLPLLALVFLPHSFFEAEVVDDAMIESLSENELALLGFFSLILLTISFVIIVLFLKLFYRRLKAGKEK